MKIDEGTKSRIEELQARIKIETGKKVTQEEVLEKVVSHAMSTEDEIIESFKELSVPLSDDEIDDFHEGISDWDEDLGEDEIDEVLYG